MSGAQLYLAIGPRSLNGRSSRGGDKLEILAGKGAEMDNRVVRIEDRLSIVPR